MKLAVDASNLSYGGGVVHLTELLGAAEPEAHGFERVTVWAPRATLERLPARPWLEPRHDPALERSFLARALWQRGLHRRLRALGADLLFVPGGLWLGRFRPYVAMSQNLLPFTPEERKRFGLTDQRLRLHVLARAQGRTFRRAAGVIFLSDTARDRVTRRVGALSGRMAVVPHGIPPRFFRDEEPAQKPLEAYGPERPFRWLYVTAVWPYKHPWVVAEAAVRLHRRGLPVRLELVGQAKRPHSLGRKRLGETLRRLDPEGEVVSWQGGVPYDRLHERYADADAFAFASTCENLPITLLEAMAAGLPVACSDRPPMPDVLGDAGVFMDPESVSSVEAAMLELTRSPELRARFAREARERARAYSWERSARETFAFLAEVTGQVAVP